jgi:3-oxoacyl-[acyl-carrier protein] reductase
MNLGLKNKNVIITGGSHGIGLETAKILAKEGCNVAILARDKKKLLLAKKQIESFNVECLTIEVDVLNEEQIEQSFEKISFNWNQIHILINNVGGGGRWGIDDFINNPQNVWQEVYDKNMTAAVRYTRFVLPFMKKQNWGRVITVTSTLGRQAGGRPWFNVAKTAQTCLMKNLSLDKKLVRHGITFNSVAPGCIMIPDTGWEEELHKNPEQFEKMVKEKFPLGRMGKPEEVAFAISMLCSEGASLINGAALAVDGGESFAF